MNYQATSTPLQTPVDGETLKAAPPDTPAVGEIHRKSGIFVDRGKSLPLSTQRFLNFNAVFAIRRPGASLGHHASSGLRRSSSNDTADTEDETFGSRKGKWMCTNCSHTNKSLKKPICALCGLDRRTAPATAPRRTSSQDDESEGISRKPPLRTRSESPTAMYSLSVSPPRQLPARSYSTSASPDVYRPAGIMPAVSQDLFDDAFQSPETQVPTMISRETSEDSIRWTAGNPFAGHLSQISVNESYRAPSAEDFLSAMNHQASPPRQPQRQNHSYDVQHSVASSSDLYASSDTLPPTATNSSTLTTSMDILQAMNQQNPHQQQTPPGPHHQQVFAVEKTPLFEIPAFGVQQQSFPAQSHEVPPPPSTTISAYPSAPF